MCSPKSDDYKNIEKIKIVINKIISLQIVYYEWLPIYNIFRNFLQTFDKSKYKNIGMIHLHTMLIFGQNKCGIQ